MTKSDEAPGTLAWVENDDGDTFSLNREGDSTMGRSCNNTIVLDDHQISRNHALIRAQGREDFLLIDLGSTNGTYINSRKIYRPTVLKDQDVIDFGSVRLRYRENRFGSSSEGAAPVMDATVFNISKKNCFLLIVDIVGFTGLSQRIPPEQLGKDVEKWIFACRKIIEDHHGIINRYLGDAVFAFWREENVDAKEIRGVILDLAEEQTRSHFEFRIVVHFGEIRVGGASLSGEDSLLGEHVNFLFRMEKLASGLKRLILFSEPVNERLDLADDVENLGEHAVHSFTGTYPFYSLRVGS